MLPISQVAMLRQSEVKVSSNLIQPLSVMVLAAFKCSPGRPCWSPFSVGICQSRLGRRQAQTQWYVCMSRMSHGDLALGTQCPWTLAQCGCHLPLSVRPSWSPDWMQDLAELPWLPSSSCLWEAWPSSPTTLCRDLGAPTALPGSAAYGVLCVMSSTLLQGLSCPQPHPETIKSESSG